MYWLSLREIGTMWEYIREMGICSTRVGSRSKKFRVDFIHFSLGINTHQPEYCNGGKGFYRVVVVVI